MIQQEKGHTMIHRFYWLIENGVAGCSRPGEPEGGRSRLPARADDRHLTDTAEELDRDLAWLRARDIGAVLSLTETPLAQNVLARHDLECLHLPVPDLTAPLPEQLTRALAFVDEQRSMNRAVAVHCLMGQGRTATVLAAFLIRGGMTAERAIEELRTMCPGAIGSQEQELALQAFAQRRDWII
jgi:atypical dual specificity phosphatase